MPRKRNNAWTRIKKQKQIITARLIEISLKVDDYIYNHKPISVSEAQLYIKEVVSYKARCNGDERSLQVIEKLTRCMNAIILEHQEMRDNIPEMNVGSYHRADIRTASVSPVYSMSDDDRTHFSQMADERARTTDANKGVEVIDLCMDDDDVTSPTNDYRNPFSRILVEVDIHRAVSNLSLQDQNKEIPDDSCSQSILDNYKGDQQQINSNMTSKQAIPLTTNIEFIDKSKMTNISQKNRTLNKVTIKAPSPVTTPNKILVPIDTVMKNVQRKSKVHVEDRNPVKTANYKGTKEKKHTEEMTQYPTLKVLEDRERSSNTMKSCTINSSHDTISQSTIFDNTVNSTSTKMAVKSFASNINILKNDYNHQDTNNSKETTILNKEKNIETNNENENTKTTKNKRAPRKKNAEVKEKINKKPTNKKVKNKKEKHPTATPENNSLNNLKTDTNVPIYNKHVENDLSWMEDIRFVREVRADESDQKLNLDESFWNNYHLPTNWNDSEFM